VKVHEWVEETNTFLAAHSAGASTGFMLVADAELTNITTHSGGGGISQSEAFRNSTKNWLYTLRTWVVIAKPEAHF
jgi:hypothetical protein